MSVCKDLESQGPGTDGERSDPILRECVTLNPVPKPVLGRWLSLRRKENIQPVRGACLQATEVCSVRGKYADLKENLCVCLIIPNVFGCHLSPAIGYDLPEQVSQDLEQCLLLRKYLWKERMRGGRGRPHVMGVKMSVLPKFILGAGPP